MANEQNSSKWSLHTAFVQANTIKGHRYLDLSGIVLNRIAELYKEVAIDPGGCVLKDPKDGKDPYAIRFSGERIWLQYAPLESLAYVVDSAPEWIDGIARDLGVSRFSRLGLRPEYFAPCTDIVRASAVLSKKISGDILQSTIAQVDDREDADVEYRMRASIGRFIATIRVGTLKIAREPKTAIDHPSDGLIFDVDIYRRAKPSGGIPRAETRGFLSSATDRVYELLERIGYNLLEGFDVRDS